MEKILAFDIGGTFIKYGIVTNTGVVLSTNKMPTNAQNGGHKMVAEVIEVAKEILGKHDDIEAIAVSTAGQVDVANGTILHASEFIPGYKGLALRDIMEQKLGKTVYVENDVNCAALAESWLGTGAGSKEVFVITLGTGIGGSIIIDGNIYRGSNYRAGEIGYMKIDGIAFEQLATPRVLQQKVELRKGMPYSSEEIFAMAKTGDLICMEEIDKMMLHLAKGLANVYYMFNPELIIIGGGVSMQKEYLEPILQRHLSKEVVAPFQEGTQIKFSAQLNEAGMIGAARHYMLSKQAANSINNLKNV